MMTEDPALREGADEERKPRGSLETGTFEGEAAQTRMGHLGATSLPGGR